LAPPAEVLAVRIVVGSAFRNSAGYVERYMRQVRELADHAGEDNTVRVIAVEGDSSDATRRGLAVWAHSLDLELELLTHNHGHPPFGSTEAPARLEALSGVGNAILAGVRQEDEVLVYVESDLIWSSHHIGSLVDIALERRGGFDVIAPMVWAGDNFYDIWGFRIGGERLEPFPPYHAKLKASGITELESAGSCLVMRAELARKVPPMTTGALVEWCANARAAGYRLGIHRDFHVRHPA
jgi:hypothetical protein